MRAAAVAVGVAAVAVGVVTATAVAWTVGSGGSASPVQEIASPSSRTRPTNSGRGERKENLLPSWRDLRQQHDDLIDTNYQYADPVDRKWFR